MVFPAWALILLALTVQLYSVGMSVGTLESGTVQPYGHCGKEHQHFITYKLPNADQGCTREVNIYILKIHDKKNLSDSPFSEDSSDL